VFDAVAALERTDVDAGHSGATIPRFSVREGLGEDDIEFGELGYARVAVESYGVFSRRKQEGRLPAGTRFQVSLPTPMSPVSTWVDPAHRATLERPYELAMHREVVELMAAIPHEDLAIQWDVCQEVLMIEGRAGFEPWFDDVWQSILSRLSRAATWIPADVEMGYHLCYGDYKHQGPMVDLPDASDLVRLANDMSDAIIRPINWIQLPVPRDRDPASYLKPLGGLRLHPETELYLGLVHLTDGRAGTLRRIEAAQQVIQRFGVSTECGFGRRNPETVRELMELHRDVADPYV